MDKGRRPKLLFLVTEDWYFCSHRLPVARAARDAGFDVAVACRVREHGDQILREGFRLVPLDWARGHANPVRALAELLRVVALYRRERPDIVHHVAVKPALMGGVAAIVAGLPAVLTTLAGRGFALSGDGWGTRLLGVVFRAVLKAVAVGRRAAVVAQNPDDADWLRQWPAAPGVEVVRGSGVDLDAYWPLPEPQGPLTVAQVSRMVALKGVPAVVGAVRRLRGEGVEVNLLLAGEPDPDNPTSLARADLVGFAAEPGIRWLGHVDDVREVWREAHVAVLGSPRGEGLPLSLLEAAACGRAIVAVDGCGTREVAQQGRNALLVPPGDEHALANAIRALAQDKALRRQLSRESRTVAEEEGLCVATVSAQLLRLYARLCGEVAPAARPAAPAQARG